MRMENHPPPGPPADTSSKATEPKAPAKKLEPRPSFSDFSENGDSDEASDVDEDDAAVTKASLLASFGFPKSQQKKKESPPSHRRKVRFRSADSYGPFGF